MRNLATPVRVGLLVVLGLVAFFVFLNFIGGGDGLGGGAKEFSAVFHDASGLAPHTQVRVAGIPVGEVTRIELEQGKARVWIKVREDITVFPNARLSKRSESILGDYLLDLDPGHPVPPAPEGSRMPRGGVIPARFDAPADGSPGAPAEPAPDRPLPSGSEIEDVKEAVALEELFESLARITDDIQAVTRSLREALAGDRNSIQELIADLERVANTIDGTISQSSVKLDRILDNAEAVSADIRAITAGKEGEIDQIVTNIRVVTEQTRSILETVQGIVGDNEGDLTESVQGIKQALGSLNRSLTSLEAVAAKVERGEGTVGMLVSDEGLARKVENTIDDASELVGAATRIRAEITLRSELLLNERGAKNYVSLRLITRPDKYYLFEVIDDPRGLVERQTVVRSPPGPDEAANQEIRVTSNDLKWSAQYAKRYGFTTLRFGIIESTGGVGANFHFFEDVLEFKVDLFEFANPDKTYPRLKAYANLLFLHHLFVTAGADDAINAPFRDETTGQILSGRDYFVGGGIYFTDDDLKGLLALVGLF